MKYVSLVLLGLLIAVLAGCGGGGDGGKRTMLEADLELVRADLEKAQADLAITKGELTRTKGELSTTRGELTRTKGTLSDTQDTLSDTQGELTKTEDTLADTQDTLSDTQGELTRTKGTLSDTQDTLSDTQGELTRTKGTLSDTQDTLATTKETLTAAQAALETTRQSLTEQETALNVLLVKAGVETAAELSTQLSNYQSEQQEVNALLVKAGVRDLTALSTKLGTDSALQTEVNAVLTATGTASLAALQTAYDTAKTNYNTLNSQVQNVLRATNSASLNALQTSVTNLQTNVDRLTTRVANLQIELGAANQKAQDAQNRVDSSVTAAEANARARSLLTNALSATANPFSGPAPVPTVRVPRKNTLSITAANYQPGSLSAPSGFKAAKLTYTAGGSQYTIVAYTDREVNRSLLDHYSKLTASDSNNNTTYYLSAKDDTQFNLEPTLGSGVTVALLSLPIKRTGVTGATNFHNHADWEIAHNFFSTTTDATPTTEKESASYSGSFKGVSGSFNCGSGCKVKLTAVYDTSTPKKLTSVTLSTDTSTKKLYFKPTALIDLSEANTESAFSGGDKEYILFGWWKNRPAVAAGVYDFQSFAWVPSGEAWPTSSGALSGTATYDGPAVGVYVEQGTLTGNTGLARHGEFTATAHLDATFGDDSEADKLSGYVDGFKATPEGSSSATPRSWRLNLAEGTVTNGQISVASNAVSFVGLTGTPATTSEWEATLLDKHEHSRLKQPEAIVGRFDASIPDLLHVVGAFGVHRRSTSLTE